MKNIVTSLFMAAAPLAMMNAAIVLSKSPLKTTIVFFFVVAPAVLAEAGAAACAVFMSLYLRLRMEFAIRSRRKVSR